MNWITQRWRPLHRYLLRFIAVGFVTLAPARAWCGDTPDVIPHPPPQRPGCAGKDFFLAQFNRALAARTYAANQAPRIEYWVEEVQQDTFLLKMLLTRWGEAPFWATPVTFGPPVECTYMVAHAANSAAEILRPPDAPPVRFWPTLGTHASFGLSPQLVTGGFYAGVGYDIPVLKNVTGEARFLWVPPYKWELEDGQGVKIWFTGALELAIRHWRSWGGLGATFAIGDMSAMVTTPRGVVGANVPFLLLGAEIIAKKQLSETVVLQVASNLSVPVARPTLGGDRLPDPGTSGAGTETGWKALWLVPSLRVGLEWKR